MKDALQRIRDAVDGKKTIITAIIGILTAALAWGAGELTDWQALAAVWVAVQIIWVRTGIKRDTKKYVLAESVIADISDASFIDGYDDGYNDGYYEDEA